MARTGGVLIDLHCHTAEKSYDGKVPALRIVEVLIQRGFAGVVFTDHNNVWTAEELVELRSAAGAPESFLLLSGQEVRTARDGVTHGDLLVYGPVESIPDGTPPAEVIALAKAAGGFCLAPHPAVPLIGFGEHLGSYPVLGAEVWNGRYGGKIAAKSRKLSRELGLAEFGGSDTHREEDIGGGGTVFSGAVSSFADLARHFREHATEPWRPRSLLNWFGG